MSLGMSVRNNVPYEELMRNFVPKLYDFYIHPQKYAMEPFRIYGNLYYIGDKKVCSHLVDTGDGLIMFDAGYGNSTFMLLDSIRKLGFRPEDIKILIISHGHFDHFGSALDIQDISGCRIYMSHVDADILRTNPDAALMELSPLRYGQIVLPDVDIYDGDTVSLGNTSIVCKAAPGHTEGTMAYFFDAYENGAAKRVGYFGGVGFLGIYKAHLEKYHLNPNMQDAMADTLKRLSAEYADITIGNHPNQNGTIEKRAYMVEHPGENPFLDETVWQELLDGLTAGLERFRAKGF